MTATLSALEIDSPSTVARIRDTLRSQLSQTTDTFSLPQSQEEFYYSMPTHVLDIVLHARNEERSLEIV